MRLRRLCNGAFGRRFVWPVPLAIALCCVVLAVIVEIDPRWLGRLDYARLEIGHGQAWRLASAHVVHLSTVHAAVNVTALVLLAWIFGEDFTGYRQLSTFAIAVVTIDTALWILHPEVVRYAGLSGVLHGWFAAAAAGWALSCAPLKRLWGVALLAGLAGKLTLEYAGGELPGPAFAVVTAAHRWGAVGGVVSAALFRLVDGRRASRPRR